eukprot:COSAG01_NODE_37496_length_502_cov_54.354839_1_plen_64_part_10
MHLSCHRIQSHEEHNASTMACRRGCGCSHFTSAFACIACDRPWEEHETVFESRAERLRAGRAVD